MDVFAQHSPKALEALDAVEEERWMNLEPAILPSSSSREDERTDGLVEESPIVPIPVPTEDDNTHQEESKVVEHPVA